MLDAFRDASQAEQLPGFEMIEDIIEDVIGQASESTVVGT